MPRIVARRRPSVYRGNMTVPAPNMADLYNDLEYFRSGLTLGQTLDVGELLDWAAAALVVKEDELDKAEDEYTISVDEVCDDIASELDNLAQELMDADLCTMTTVAARKDFAGKVVAWIDKVKALTEKARKEVT